MQSISLKGLSLMFVAVVGTSACSTEVPDLFSKADKAQEAVLLVESSRNGSFSGFAAMANLQPMNQSGIRARIEFLDDGTTLTVTGAATGLHPAESYVTLIYDNGSVPGGPNGCAPTIFDPQDPGFVLGTMLIGFWNVDSEGIGSLFNNVDEIIQLVVVKPAVDPHPVTQRIKQLIFVR